jgi:nucleoid-associated protein YgaU|tara:strand:+ start:570 stop:845 length:276 start_codon:yes stop_codon:yes gene_type:complete
MARYQNTPVRKNKDTNKSYYNTTIYQKVPERNDDMYFIAQEGDRCDNLANRFYNDSSLWWFIARVNDLTANNIPAGTSLRIPVSTKDAKGF